MLAALLLAGAAAQLLFDRPPPLPAAVGGASIARAPVPAAPRVGVPQPLLDRPLFASLDAGGGSAQPALLGGAVVAGAVGRGGRRAAVIVQPGKSVMYLPVGGILAGWQLAVLEPDAAQFRRGDERIRIPYGSAAPDPAEAEADAEMEAEDQ